MRLPLTLLLLLATCLCGTVAQAAPVFTVFAHGTGGHRSGRDLELITEFGACCWGRGTNENPNAFYKKAYQNSFLILDGVGTSDMYTTPKGPAMVGLATLTRPGHAMPGDFKPDSLDKPLKPANLRRLHKKKQFPTTINMIGWSRGAVTCIKLANAICDHFVDGKPYSVLKDYKKGYVTGNMVQLYPAWTAKVPASKITLNLFLIDPVPGRFGVTGEEFGSKRSVERMPPGEKDYQQLPRIVKRCIVTLASDEQRSGFVPLDADKVKILSPKTTTAVWLPFPGIHRTQLRLAPRDPLDAYNKPAVRNLLTGVPKVAWDLAWRFMTGHGSTFERKAVSKLLTRTDIVDLYSQMWLQKEQYHQARNRGTGQRLQGGLRRRLYTGYPFTSAFPEAHKREHLFTAELGVYVKYPGFFINEHHRACFVKKYPRLYAYLTGAMPKSLTVPTEAAGELKALSANAHLLKHLSQLGLTKKGTGFVVKKGFRFGAALGAPLHKNKTAKSARFTGLLKSMHVVP